MNIFKELEEVGDMQFKLKKMADSILDLYKKYPKKCEILLKELNIIDNELTTLDKEFTKLQNEF